MTDRARERVHEVDLLRGVAIIGMMVAHLGPRIDEFSLGEPSTWWAVSDGHPSAVFAFLAGVSLELMTRSALNAGGVAVVQARVKLMTRGVILMVLGLVVIDLQVVIAGILTTYGVLFLLLAFCFRWRMRTVAIALVVLVLAGPVLVAALRTDVLPVVLDGPGFDLLAGSYPLLAWLAYAFGGLLVARLLRRDRGAWLMILLAGVLLMILDYAGPVADPSDFRGAFLDPEPHSGGLREVLGNLGLGAVLLMLLLVLMRSRVARVLAYPVRAIGMMPLTIYVLHVLTAAAFLGGYVTDADGPRVSYRVTDTPWPVSPAYLVGSIVIALLAASIWMRFFRRGPLEGLIHLAGNLAAGLIPTPAPIRSAAPVKSADNANFPDI